MNTKTTTEVQNYDNSPLKALVDELCAQLNTTKQTELKELCEYIKKELPSVANKFKKEKLDKLDVLQLVFFAKTLDAKTLDAKIDELIQEQQNKKEFSDIDAIILNSCKCIQKHLNDGDKFKGLDKIAPFVNKNFNDTIKIPGLDYELNTKYTGNDITITANFFDEQVDTIVSRKVENFFSTINARVQAHIKQMSEDITKTFENYFPCSKIINNINLKTLSFDDINIEDWNDGINKLNALEACITAEEPSTTSKLLCLINEKYVLININPAITNNNIINKAKQQIIRKLKDIINTETQNRINCQTASSRQQLPFTISENMQIDKQLNQALIDATRKIETDFTNKTKEQERQELAKKLDKNALTETRNQLNKEHAAELEMTQAYENCIAANNAAEVYEEDIESNLQKMRDHAISIAQIVEKIKFIENVISVQNKLENAIDLTDLRAIQPPVAPKSSGFEHIQTAIAAHIQNKIEDTHFNNIKAEIAELTEYQKDSWISTRISTLRNNSYIEQLKKLFEDKNLMIETELRKNIWNDLESHIKTRFECVYEKNSTEELLKEFYAEVNNQIYIKINDFNRQPPFAIKNDDNKYAQIDTDLIKIIKENLNTINTTIENEAQKCEKENYNHKMYSILTLGIYALARIIYILVAHKEFYSTNKYQSCKNEVAKLNENLLKLSSSSISAN